MTALQKMTVFITWLSVGIVQPVFSLLLLGKGAILTTLPAAIGVYSITVLTAEFPSGVFADIFGRKAAFMLSVLLNICAALILLFSHTFPFVIAVMFLLGLGRAFSSGSLDALIIDDCLAKFGKDYTVKVTSQLAVCQGLGVSIGALAGGFLPVWDGYGLHLGVKILLLTAAGILCLMFVKEKPVTKSERVPVTEHLRGCFAVVKVSDLIKVMLPCVFAAGFLLISVETYWQPVFASLVDTRQTPLLGVICFIGFGASTAGNFLMQKLRIRPDNLQRHYFRFKLLIGAFAVVLAAQTSASGFIVCYGILYFILGLSDITEQTLLNNRIPSDKRASLMSLLSLLTQSGGFAASGAAFIFIGLVGYGGIWVICGIFVLLVSLAGMILLRHAANGAEIENAAIHKQQETGLAGMHMHDLK